MKLTYPLKKISFGKWVVPVGMASKQGPAVIMPKQHFDHQQPWSSFFRLLEQKSANLTKKATIFPDLPKGANWFLKGVN